MRSHRLIKTRAISAIETDMLAIGEVMNNLYLHYDYLLCTKFNIVDTCDHLEDLFITFTRHFWNNDCFSVF